MTRLTTVLCAGLCATAFVVAAKPAQAQLFISYVSNTGSDTAGCYSPATACQTFAGALGKTMNQGEIDCVNSGNYGEGFTIAQSITIDCAGGVGSEFGQITISGGADIVVRLRNSSFNRYGDGFFGIDAQNMAALYIENCVITNANPGNSGEGAPPFIGIKFEPSANAQLFISNSVISNNGASTGATGGIYIVPATGVTANVSIDRSQINGNSFGVIADGTSGGTVKGTISDSVVSGNTVGGIAVTSSGSDVLLLVDQTKVSGNAYGLVVAGSGAGILARNSSVFGNTVGLHNNNSGGALVSYGNNSVSGNATNGAFTFTVSQQ
jgi:hypothetical protein